MGDRQGRLGQLSLALRGVDGARVRSFQGRSEMLRGRDRPLTGLQDMGMSA